MKDTKVAEIFLLECSIDRNSINFDPLFTLSKYEFVRTILFLQCLAKKYIYFFLLGKRL